MNIEDAKKVIDKSEDVKVITIDDVAKIFGK